jgi:hypothetical protein
MFEALRAGPQDSNRVVARFSVWLNVRDPAYSCRHQLETGMSNLSTAVRALEDRRAALTSELDQVNAQLRSIGQALGTAGSTKAVVAKAVIAKRSPSPAPAAKPAAKAAPGKQAPTRRWFEPGEAVTLMQRMATKPMRPSDIIKGLASMKGYAGKLNKQAQERFTWAATSALKAAIQAKRLLRNKDGSITAPAASK